MLTLIIIGAIYAGIATLILTDNNGKKYTDYQIRRLLAQANISHQ